MNSSIQILSSSVLEFPFGLVSLVNVARNCTMFWFCCDAHPPSPQASDSSHITLSLGCGLILWEIFPVCSPPTKDVPLYLCFRDISLHALIPNPEKFWCSLLLSSCWLWWAKSYKGVIQIELLNVCLYSVLFFPFRLILPLSGS